MSRYGIDKVLWLLQPADGRRRFKADPAAFVADAELTDQERTALLNLDAGELYRLGAHPFLLWGALFDLHDRAPAYRDQYTAAIAPHGYPDHAT
jgi:hypothetical protein